MTFDIFGTPDWAQHVCYVYFAGAFIVVATILFVFVKEYKKMSFAMIVAFLISGSISTLMAMMEFWICRGALVR
jgi:hypothetical protein